MFFFCWEHSPPSRCMCCTVYYHTVLYILLYKVLCTVHTVQYSSPLSLSETLLYSLCCVQYRLCSTVLFCVSTHTAVLCKNSLLPITLSEFCTLNSSCSVPAQREYTVYCKNCCRTAAVYTVHMLYSMVIVYTVYKRRALFWKTTSVVRIL